MIPLQNNFFVSLWKIWKGRNDLIFNQSPFNPIDIASSSAEFVEDYNVAIWRPAKPLETLVVCSE